MLYIYLKILQLYKNLFGIAYILTLTSPNYYKCKEKNLSDF